MKATLWRFLGEAEGVLGLALPGEAEGVLGRTAKCGYHHITFVEPTRRQSSTRSIIFSRSLSSVRLAPSLQSIKSLKYKFIS